MLKGRILVFASGDTTGGGSGFQELIENSRSGVLPAEIVAVVSNHGHGGVREIASTSNIPFIFMDSFEAKDYQSLYYGLEKPYVALSGWLKLVKGLPDHRTFNIHPGPLPEFGGKGMYGHYIHEAVIAAFKVGKIKYSAVTMHFVSEKYDSGAIFFQFPVLIRPNDTPETLAARVNKIEHGWQSWITGLVVSGKISLDAGKLIVPSWYKFHQALT